MKTIKDKKITTKPSRGSEESPFNSSYFELCQTVLEAVDPKIGLTMKGVRARNKSLDVLEKAKDGVATFEDSEFNVLYECVEKFPWNMVSKEIVEFVDYLDEVKKQEDKKGT